MTFAALPRRSIYRTGARRRPTDAGAGAGVDRARAGRLDCSTPPRSARSSGAPRRRTPREVGRSCRLVGRRGRQFLKLLGGAKHGATAKKRKAQSKGDDDLKVSTSPRDDGAARGTARVSG